MNHIVIQQTFANLEFPTEHVTNKLSQLLRNSKVGSTSKNCLPKEITEIQHNYFTNENVQTKTVRNAPMGNFTISK